MPSTRIRVAQVFAAALLALLPALAHASGDIVILYSAKEADAHADQHLKFVCAGLRELGSQHPIFRLERHDRAIDLLRQIQFGDKQFADSTPGNLASCEKPSEQLALADIRDCVMERITHYWNLPSSSSLEACFGDLPERAPLPAVALGFESAADSSTELQYDEIEIRSGLIGRGQSAYLDVSVPRGTDGVERQHLAVSELLRILGVEDATNGVRAAFAARRSLREKMAELEARAGASRRRLALASIDRRVEALLAQRDYVNVVSVVEDALQEPPFPWALFGAGAGVALVGGVVGTLFYTNASNDWEQARAACEPRVEGVCRAGSKGPELSRSADHSANLATLSYALAGIGAAGALTAFAYYQYLVLPKHEAEVQALGAAELLDVQLSRESYRLLLRGTF
jgi:hypothetical protein